MKVYKCERCWRKFEKLEKPICPYCGGRIFWKTREERVKRVKAE